MAAILSRPQCVNIFGPSNAYIDLWTEPSLVHLMPFCMFDAVFKIRSQTSWTEAQFCQNLYMTLIESLLDPNFAGQDPWSGIILQTVNAKSSHEPVLHYLITIINCMIGNKLHWIFNQNIEIFLSRKYIWKCYLLNIGHFVQASICEDSSDLLCYPLAT